MAACDHDVIIPPQYALPNAQLNSDQQHVFDLVMAHLDRCERSHPLIVHVEADGGTGKTFLARAVMCTVRKSR
jgi:pantothenate kinase-related protein Tda10